jgi:hypothetical protein
MKIKIRMFCLSFFLCGGLVFAGDSSSNRDEQTVRLGQKSGKHLMYFISTPLVLEFPDANWTLGLTSGSGKYNYSYTNYNSTSGAYSTKTQSINFSTQEVTARYYIGNSFNIPLGYANYKISYPDWIYSGVTYDIEYSITQLNYGIGNEWTYDWGAYLGMDWYQGGIKLSDETKITIKSGTETSKTLQNATTTSTDIKAFAGELVLTFGFGF